ncbi:hypothetical protein VK98_08135 [Chromobacterium sp. LK11]|uniref:MFS transporter n=1 Tax=Chromobacterium sp. LK11 TaxID=1628212 RepID=UPI000653AE74|nr:MFS transporter [Chromobacterium sp. LK11]KMN82411.1 hypothetical protein VK98_08135 [Chromobacterium sp. LK11]
MKSAIRAAPLALLILLLGFPQLSETIYAPALTEIALAYHVSAGQAQLTMSVYFLAFAFGVVCWGRCADVYGRRPALLAALACYGAGALLAVLSRDFAVLLLARLLLAFGASAGSVVVQTMLRDRYQGPALLAVFATVSAALSLSPALGPPLGALLVAGFGHQGVFAALCGLAALLLLLSCKLAGETRPADLPPPAALGAVAARMARDPRVLATVWLVAGFNLLLFGFYTLAPFTLQLLGMPPWLFGLSGLLVAAGGLFGAFVNRRLAARGGGERLPRLALTAATAAALIQLFSAWPGLWPIAAVGVLLVCQLAIAAAFGCAIPPLLAEALRDYRQVQGTAGALLGLMYYLLIAGGLGLISAAYQPHVCYQPLVMALLCAAMWPAARRLER